MMQRFHKSQNVGVCDHDDLRQTIDEHLRRLESLGLSREDDNTDDFWRTVEQLATTRDGGGESDSVERKLLEIRRVSPNDIDEFWRTVQRIDWARDQDVDAAKRRYHRLRLTEKERAKTFEIAALFRNVLGSLMYEKFGDCVPTPGADDSYGDFLWSAVGHGRQYYESLFSESQPWDFDDIGAKTSESFAYVVDVDDNDEC